MYKDPSDMSLLFSQLFCKINTLLALLFDQNNISEEKYYFNNNSYINFVCLPLFQLSVSLQKCRLVWYSWKPRLPHNPTLHSDTRMCCFFVLSATNTTPNSLSFLCLLCFASCLLGSLMEKMCHSRCVV